MAAVHQLDPHGDGWAVTLCGMRGKLLARGLLTFIGRLHELGPRPTCLRCLEQLGSPLSTRSGPSGPTVNPWGRGGRTAAARMSSFIVLFCCLGVPHEGRSQTSTGSILGTQSDNASTFIAIPRGLTITGNQLTPPTSLTITRSKDCAIVVLENTTEKIVLSCLKEIK